MFDDFFFPHFDRRFMIRLLIVAAICISLFGFILMPCIISGKSMQPAYDSVGFNFCNKLAFKFSSPKHGDIVILKYIDRKYFLKRIIGLEGDTIEFRNGKLFRNEVMIEEDYVKKSCDWNISPIVVRKGYVYAVGDNRSMPPSQHKFGLITVNRIKGAPLW